MTAPVQVPNYENRAVSMSDAVLRPVVSTALEEYASLTNGELEFDLKRAGILHPAPRLNFAAMSKTTVKHAGEAAASLTVMAFGAGDDNRVAISRHRSTMPSPQSRIATEAWLSIATFPGLEEPGDPLLFLGSLRRYSSPSPTDTKASVSTSLPLLGRPPSHYRHLVSRRQGTVLPTLVLTIERSADPDDRGVKQLNPGDDSFRLTRNVQPELQVWATITVDQAMASNGVREVLRQTRRNLRQSV